MIQKIGKQSLPGIEKNITINAFVSGKGSAVERTNQGPGNVLGTNNYVNDWSELVALGDAGKFAFINAEWSGLHESQTPIELIWRLRIGYRDTGFASQQVRTVKERRVTVTPGSSCVRYSERFQVTEPIFFSPLGRYIANIRLLMTYDTVCGEAGSKPGYWQWKCNFIV